RVSPVRVPTAGRHRRGAASATDVAPSTSHAHKAFSMVCVAVEALRRARTELLVLAVGGEALAAVDLTTGGLVRAPLPNDCWLAPYDVAATALADVDDPDPAQPEAVDLAGPLEV